MADVNGDGLSDVVSADPQHSAEPKEFEIQIMMSKGYRLDTSGFSKTFRFTGVWAHMGDGTCDSKKVMARDFNGDGRSDLLLYGSSNGSNDPAYRIALSKGQKFDLANGARPRPYISTEDYYEPDRVADFTGDGLPDFYDGSSGDNMRKSDGKIADLLSTFKTPLGGTETVTYMASPQTENPKIPFVMHVVKSITTDDGRGIGYTTNFSYQDAKWSPEERQFLGFHTVTATLPCIAGEMSTSCPLVETNFKQAVNCYGRVDSVYHRENDPARAATPSQTLLDHVYATDDVLPHRCLEVSDKQLGEDQWRQQVSPGRPHLRWLRQCGHCHRLWRHGCNGRRDLHSQHIRAQCGPVRHGLQDRREDLSVGTQLHSLEPHSAR